MPSPKPTETDVRWMRHALELAKQAWGQTHPNPMVGAVAAEGEHCLAEGWHEKAGEAHAEVKAIAALKKPPSPETTLYVTLEPCCTHGRTGPCTEAIIKAGFKRVVVGAIDPNPDHSGRGIDKLKAAGIEVLTRVLETECNDLNLLFNHWITHRQPLIAGKVALTLDGLIATRSGHSQWITGELARADVHRWRRYFPAIAVGSETAIADDPRLTARVGSETWCPQRFVFDRRLRLLLDCPRAPMLLNDSYADHTTLVIDDHVSQPALKALRLLHSAKGVNYWVLPKESFFLSFRRRCAEEGLTGVLVEGGGTVLSALLHAELLDYLFAYRAPVLLADMDGIPAFTGQAPEKIAGAHQLKQVRHAILGEDQLMRGFLSSAQS